MKAWQCGGNLSRFNNRVWVAGFIILLFFGAMFWAKGRDPFQRIWFTVKTPTHGKAKCIAVLPKTTAKPFPVVIYLHGSGGSILNSGVDLRQMAEMGLATVAIDYSETNVAGFDEHFTALLNYLQRQRWADMSKTAWVGFSLGAQGALSFALKHPEAQPRLLVRVGGGWVSELDSLLTNHQSRFLNCPVLLLHGDQDAVFPILQVERVATVLRSDGVPVDLRILPGQSHDFEPNRALIFRAIGEYCLAHLKGSEALIKFRSILSWQNEATPLWVYWIPAFVWACLWVYWKRRVLPLCAPRKLTRVEIGLRWLAAILATAAIAQTALNLIPPRVAVSERTLAIARKYLVQPKERKDFEYAATNRLWQAKKLKILLTHVELANYNRELVNWKLDDVIYREFVLSPVITGDSKEELNWRRGLWENFYPRIRKEQSTESAAEIVVRFLRERITIANGENFPTGVETIWTRQITNEKGFERIYVAALRSVGVPSRLNSENRAEMRIGDRWQLAPRPLIFSW